MEEKVRKLLSRFEEVESLLGKPETLLDKKLYRQLTQEYSYLSEVKGTWERLCRLNEELIKNNSLLLTEKDPDLIEVIKEEIADLEREIGAFQKKIQNLLVPPDPRDSRDIILELRAGTGGKEAALFVADCVRMYILYAQSKSWKYEPISATPSDGGGYKEYIMSLSGPNVFRLMQYEAGTHRVQRVPETETQGRIHTSAVTVAVLLEPTEEDSIDIDDKELKIETFRASGAGGQHVNVTDSAVRITHLPSGTVVSCQEERSQHKNKERAMRLLMARLLEQRRMKRQKEMADIRAIQIGTGGRAERIRTYNYPQNRVTDHRVEDLTLYKLDRIMEGDLDDITMALVSYFYQKEIL